MLQTRFNDKLSQQEAKAIMGVEGVDWSPFETDPDWWEMRMLLVSWFGGSTEYRNMPVREE